MNTVTPAKKVSPSIAAKGPLGFVLWARQDHPALYQYLLKTVPAVAAVEQAITVKTLGDWSDIFSSIGSGISSAASAVSSGVSSAWGSISKAAIAFAPAAGQIAGTLINANQQKQLLNTQLQLANAYQRPAQMATLPNGQVVPVQPGVMGQTGYNYGGQVYSPYSPGAFGGIPTGYLIAGAGGLLLVVLLALRK
jgi:hypothetical protein